MEVFPRTIYVFYWIQVERNLLEFCFLLLLLLLPLLPLLLTLQI
jgi:hypothetical protein